MESRFFEPSDNSNLKSFPSPPSDTVILVTPDFSKYPIFRTNFRFPLRFEKFGFNCNFGMIIRLFDVRIASVFVFNAIWVRLYNTCFRAWCTFFRAIRSPPPQVQWCPYAYANNINMTKTEFMLIECRQRLSTLTESPTFAINDFQDSQVATVKTLVTIDDRLVWSGHIEKELESN